MARNKPGAQADRARLPNPPAGWHSGLQPYWEVLQARWSALAPREQRGLRIAVLAVLVALAWSALFAPALRTLQRAPEQIHQLDVQLEHMRQLQARAGALRTQAGVSAGEALKMLQASIADLGAAAKLQVVGDQATLNLQHADAVALAHWLAQPGAALRVQPGEVHLQSDGGSPASWSGTLVFTLPPGGDKP